MATFKWYLNRQGPQGQRGQEGAKGDPGNTPIFSDGQNTPTVYTMIIDLGDGNTFETKNLKYPMRDDGGDYLRYDISEDTVYLGEPNKADLAGKEGEVRLATTTSVAEETVLDTDAVSYELFEDNNEKVTTALGNLDDKIEDVDDKVDAEADTRARNDGILDNRINLAEGQITSLNNTKASKQELTDGLAGKANVVHTHTLSQITDAGALAGQNVVDYQSQVINKPIIPTPGNGTITIAQGGVIKGTFTTNQSGDSTISLDAGGSSSLTGGNGINISNNVVSAKVDNDTINFDSSGNLVANIPDVSNFVTNSSLATTLQSYPTNTQLANTLEDYPTKTSQQNIINYELATWDDFSYSDKEFSYAKFPFIGSDECPFYYNEPTGDITATSTGFRFNNNCVKYSIGTYEITPGPTQVRFKAKQGDRIIITSADYVPLIRYEGDVYVPDYDRNIDDGHTCISDDYFSATMDFVSDDTSGSELNYQIEVLQDCLISEIETIKTRVVSPVGTYSFEYVMANNNPAIEFVVPLDLNGHVKAIFNPDVAGDGLKINSVNKDRIEVDVDGTTIGINDSGKLTYVGTTGDVLPSQTGNSGKFLTTDGSATSWATIPQPDLTNYYTKTQTDSLLGAKITGGAVQYPLFYQPDTTSSVKLNNISPISLTGSADNGYTSDNNSLTNPVFNIKDFTNNDYKNVADYPELLDQPELCYAEYELKNGINTQFYSGGWSSSSGVYAGVAGYYDNRSFIPTILLYPGCSSYTYYRHIVFTETPSVFTGGNAYQMSSSSTIMALGDDLTNCAASIVSTSGGNGWVIGFTTEEKELIDRSTHFRVMGIGTSQGATTTINLNTYKAVNPTFSEQWCPTSGGSSSTWAAYENSTNIFNVHPESLSLKYDSNTLGVNANNELYAISSTPSNMVTTNTEQTITASKAFHPADGLSYCQIGGYYGTHYGGYISAKRYDSDYPERSTMFAVNLGNNKSGSISFSDNNLNSIGGLSVEYDYLTLKSRTETYYVQKNNSNSLIIDQTMLDGTTITYNSSTNKISAAGGSTPTKKTITQASANVSESSGTVTVTDADVTTSTMVSLYPSDTATEAWLTNNLASNIITEGSGSFTFTINGNLPSTFSMYYIIQEVS